MNFIIGAYLSMDAKIKLKSKKKNFLMSWRVDGTQPPGKCAPAQAASALSGAEQGRNSSPLPPTALSSH